MSNIGKNIKFLRRSSRISQEKLASVIGLNRGNIASYEGGKVLPSAENLLKIAAHFDINMGDMIHKDLSSEDYVNQSELNGIALPYTERIGRIIQGMQEYHEMRKPDLKDIPEQYAYLVHDYERLLQLISELLRKSN